MQHKIASLQAIAQKPANYVKYYEYYLKWTAIYMLIKLYVLKYNPFFK